MTNTAIALAVVSISCASARSDGSHDFTVASRDVRVTDGGGAAAAGYEYVARLPLAIVALAESRGMDAATARAAINALAETLDACVAREARKGTFARGAARVVAQIAPDGSVAQTSLRVEPGNGVMENAVVCLLAPAKLLSFPVIDAGVRGMAIEALWGSAEATDGRH
jgi:hypothetical protein